MTFLPSLLRYTIAKVRISWEHDRDEWKGVGVGTAAGFAFAGWMFLPRAWLWVWVWENAVKLLVELLVAAFVGAVLFETWRWLRDRYREWRAMGK